jgi:hypothetical protein
LENSRTKWGDVLNLQELEAALEHMETLQTMRESFREQQFQANLEFTRYPARNQEAAQCLFPA